MKKVVDEEAIFMRLNAIEQKLEMVFSRTQVDMLPENISEDNGEINEDEFETAHPLEAMAVYLKEGNVVKAERMLGRLESRLNVDGFLALIPPMLALGSLKAASIFKSRLQTIRQQDEGTRLTLIGAYVTYCNIKNFEPEEYDFIDVELTELAKQSQTAELRIQILNQRNRIAYGAYATLENRGEPNEVFRKKAIESLDEAIKLDSGFTLPSLWYNRALILFDMGDVDRAKEDVDIYLLHQTDGKDFDQLALAYKVYRKIGDKERMYFIEKEMRELDPRRLKALKITLD